MVTYIIRCVSIVRVLFAARTVQRYLWQEDEAHNTHQLLCILEKRLTKIRELDTSQPHYKVELRKRLLQNAAVSIKFLELIEGGKLEVLS